MDRRRRGAVGIVLAIVLVLLSVAASPPRAFAHAALESATPPAGSEVPASPVEFRLEFNEPLNRELSSAALTDSENDRRIDASVVVDRRSITVKPGISLPRGSYRVDWRAVSTYDGHPVLGVFAVGVRRPAISPSSTELGPLAENRVVRIMLRAAFYAAVLIFVGGLLISALWTPRRREEDLQSAESPPGLTGQTAILAGSAAVISGLLLLLADAANAGGSLRPSVLEAYTFDTDSGRARLLAVVGLALALGSTLRRKRSWAIGFAIAAVLAIAFSGHANSADPRVVALVTDWLHLLAASIWIGGLFHLALAFVRRDRLENGDSGPKFIGTYDRTSELVLPAFLATVVTGLYNAAIELGAISMLWQSSYGVVLAVKLVFVLGLVVVARFHTRLRRGKSDSKPSKPDQARWFGRLITAEPALAIGIFVAAATLAVFPTPPRQASTSIAQSEQTDCGSCLTPGTGETALAARAGSTLVALSIRSEGTESIGTIRLLDGAGTPVNRKLSLENGQITESCGTGCVRFSTNVRQSRLRGEVVEGAQRFKFQFPAVSGEQSSPRASAIVADAQAAMQKLRTFRADERIAVNETVSSRTAFESQSPDRLGFSADSGAAGVVIGSQRWNRASADASWTGPETDSEAYRTSDAFTWKQYARRAWVIRDEPSESVVTVALMDPDEPVWYELLVERGSKRVLKEQMRSPGHFMTTRYFDFGADVSVEPPDA